MLLAAASLAVELAEEQPLVWDAVLDAEAEAVEVEPSSLIVRLPHSVSRAWMH